MYIAIAGNIGSGKSTLTEKLAKYYGWIPKYETVTYNPYLEDYYADIPRWAFAMEIYYLKQRFRDLLAINQSSATIVQDRSIFEGVYVFARNNKLMGNLSERDYNTYMELFEQMLHVAKMPDLMIYLRSSVAHLINNIQHRGRNYEQQMPLNYLENLNKLYEDFIFSQYKGNVLVINVDTLDFLHRPRDLGDIIDRIDARLYGLFPTWQQ